MGYFQTQNPWMEAAQYGQALGQTLGRHLLEVPRVKAENQMALAREPMQLALQQEQLNTSRANQAQQAQMLPMILEEMRLKNTAAPHQLSLGMQRDAAATENYRANTARDRSVTDEMRQRQEALPIWSQMMRTQLNEPINYVEQNPPLGLGGDIQQGVTTGVGMGLGQQQMEPLLELLQQQQRQPLIQSQIDLNNAQTTRNLRAPTMSMNPKDTLNAAANLVKILDTEGMGLLPSDPNYPQWLAAKQLLNEAMMQVQQTMGADNTVRVFNPSGKPVRIPKEQLNEALTKGYKLNQ